MPDEMQLLKFQAELLSILEKNKFILTRYLEDGFGVQGEETIEVKVKVADFFKLYEEGMHIEDIAKAIMSNQRKMPEKPDLDNIYPLLKDKYFVIAYHDAIKRKAGEDYEQALPILFKKWQNKEIFIMCGIFSNENYRLLSTREFSRYNVDEKQFMRAIMENLDRKIMSIINNNEVKITKMQDGAYKLYMPQDMAASFILLAPKYFEKIKEWNGRESQYFNIITLTTEQILICDEKLSIEDFKKVIIESKKEQVDSIHHPMNIEPIMLTKDGLGFLN